MCVRVCFNRKKNKNAKESVFVCMRACTCVHLVHCIFMLTHTQTHIFIFTRANAREAGGDACAEGQNRCALFQILSLPPSLSLSLSTEKFKRNKDIR
jgi:hypothetical protein